MSALNPFKCCEHCPPHHNLGGPDEHVYPCDATDDGKLCEQGNQHTDEDS